MKIIPPEKSTFNQYARQYEDALLQDILPFWSKNSLDDVHGGYFSCLDRDGRVFDKDKFIWLQARQVWTYSMLYNRFERQSAWLDMASHGAHFLKKYGRDENGNWYFSLNRQGQPLIQPYNIFSDCFAAMAFGQYAIASGDEASAQIARETFENIKKRSADPKGRYNKAYPGTRPFKGFAFPMIMSNLFLELEPILEDQNIDSYLDQYTGEIMDYFLDPDKNIFYEFVLQDGSHHDSMDGRLINPGHGIEGIWFLMDIAERQKNQELITRLTGALLDTLAFGWDQEYGGIYYFMDVENKPPQQLEWDQKLWWPHLESLVALSKAYLLTGNESCWQWYQKIHDYAWQHFPDPEYGEWFGYLNRQGTPHLWLKGGKWKGFFHVPRALFQCRNNFIGLSQQKS